MKVLAVLVVALVFGCALAQDSPDFFVPHSADLYDGDIYIYWEDDTVGLRFEESVNLTVPQGWDWDLYYSGEELFPGGGGCFFPVGVSETFDMVLPTSCVRDENAKYGLRCGSAEEQAKSLMNVNSPEYAEALNVGVDGFPFLVNHLALDWNPCGHPPFGVYWFPHWDWHFYSVTPGIRDLMRCSFFPPCLPDEVSYQFFLPIPETAVPTNYVADFMTAVPNMGLHALDTTDPQFNENAGQPWQTASLVFGYWNGTFAFFEPMFSNYMFLNYIEYEAELPQPAIYQVEGQWPRIWGLRYVERDNTVYWDGYLTDLVYAKPGETPDQARARHNDILARESQIEDYSSSAATLVVPLIAIVAAVAMAF